MRSDRREFLRQLAIGSTVVTMPAFLSGCGVAPAIAVAEPMPEDPFLDWFQIDRALIGKIMTALTAKGAERAELYFQHRRQSTLRMQAGEIKQSNVDVLQGVGMRVMLGERSGFAFTEDFSLGSMLATASLASSSLEGVPVVMDGRISASPAGVCYVTDVNWADIDLEQKRRVLQRVDGQARNADSAVDDVSISWSDTDERVLIVTLDGQMIFDHRPMTRLSAQVSATRAAETHSGFANIAARDEMSWYTDARIDEMTQQAVDRTLLLFDARRPPVGEMPVILSAGTSGVLLHEAVGHALEADFNRDGKSAYADKLGEGIADASVNIIDQGDMPNERGALNYDDEGNVCGRTTLVEKGVLRSYLHDGLSARQYGVAVTGTGRRESYRHEPMPRMTCTFMENGPHDQDELVAAMGRGIIAETYTKGSVDLGAGDYKFYVKSGWLVEKGKILMPVRDFYVVGNGPDTLRDITMVANNSRLDEGGWTCGKNGQTVPVSMGMPSVLVSKLTIQSI